MGLSLRDIGKFLQSDKAKAILSQVTGMPIGGRDGDPEDYEASGGISDQYGFTNKDSLENRGIIPRTRAVGDIPPPVRTVTTSKAAPLPEPTVTTMPNMPDNASLPIPGNIPPPTRNPVPITTAPPSPDYIAPMESVYNALPEPNLSKAWIDEAGNTRGQIFNNRAAAVPAPTRTVMPDYGTAQPVPSDPGIPPPTRVFMGERTNSNMTSAERAAARVRALETADPSSRVHETPEGYAIDPPKKLGRLKAMGKMFLQRMLAGAPYGIGGMLGAGITGSIEGGVALGHAQKVLRQDELARAQGEQNTAQTLEGRQIQNDAAKINLEQDKQSMLDAPKRQRDAEYERERTNFEQGVAQLDKVGADDPERQRYIQALQTEADRLSEKYGKKVTLIPGQGREPTRLSVDGQVVEFGPDGQPKVVFGQPKTDTTDANHDQDAQYKWEAAKAEADAKRAAAEQAVSAAESLANNYQQKVSAAAATVSTLDAQMKDMPAQIPDPARTKPDGTPYMIANPALGPLKRQRADAAKLQTEAQKGMEDAYRQRDTHKAKAGEFAPPPPPPRRGNRPTATGRTMSQANLERYAKDHNMTAEQAKASPELQGIVIR